MDTSTQEAVGVRTPRLNRSGATPRIAVYLHSLYNGGVERVMINLMQAFLDRGYLVDLVLDFLEWSPFESMLPVGARVVKLDARRAAQRLPKLVRYLRETRPDALLSATHLANEIACLAKFVAGVDTRLVLTEHGNMSSDIGISSSKLRQFLLPRGTKLLYPLADSVVAVSNGVAEDVSRVSGFPRERVATIYNPIDFAKLSAMGREPVSEAWFDAGEPPVIVAIGRLEEQKNFPMLLRAFAEVRATRPVRMIILGEGSLRASLEALVAEMGLEDVKLPGFVANPAAYIARAGVFAMSSSWEGMPVALIEALALGTPVVSTDCPSGPVEILDGGKYGELVPLNDSAALAKAIRAVLDGERKSVPGEWLRKFDADVITEQYLKLLVG